MRSTVCRVPTARLMMAMPSRMTAQWTLPLLSRSDRRDQMSKTIMLIHGAWLNAHSWEGFEDRYEARGCTVIAPAWPLDDRSPAELRASPNPALAKVGINELIDHYDRLIRALPEPPILIGHSFGGTVTQHLLDRGLGAAGVVIDPAPPACWSDGRPSSRPFLCSCP